MLKRLDIYIAGALLIVAGVLFFALRGFYGGGQIRIWVGSELVGTYYLSENQVIPVAEGHATVTIKDGKFSMTESDCPDKLCVRQGWIERGAIVCLPNQIVVETVSKGGADAVTG